MPKIILDEMVEDFGVDEATVHLYEVFGQPKDKLKYTYDFGDHWLHDIVLEKVKIAEPDTVLPVCLAGRRACPPEDCGGVPGYENVLDVLSNPEDEEYEEMIDWVGGDFDSEEFDCEEANGEVRGMDWEDPEKDLLL